MPVKFFNVIFLIKNIMYLWIILFIIIFLYNVVIGFTRSQIERKIYHPLLAIQLFLLISNQKQQI
jgi:hypothetical protein